MSNDFNHTEFISRLSGLESKVEENGKNTERRIQKLETDNETLNRLVVVAELQKESMDKQQELMDIMNRTLKEVSDSNNNISNEIQGVKEDVATLNTKVENIEATDTVNVPQLIKKYGALFFGAIITGLAGFVLIKFGLK